MQSKNVNFYEVETVNEGGKMVKKSQKLVNVVCQQPLTTVFFSQMEINHVIQQSSSEESQMTCIPLKELHVQVPIFTCLTDFAATLNASVNVIIYSIFGKKFREKFVAVFCPTNEQGGGRLNIVVKKQPNATRSTLYTETAVPTGTQVVTTEV